MSAEDLREGVKMAIELIKECIEYADYGKRVETDFEALLRDLEMIIEADGDEK